TGDFHGLPPLIRLFPKWGIVLVDDYAPMPQPVNETRCPPQRECRFRVTTAGSAKGQLSGRQIAPGKGGFGSSA
ncbi:hypothetical protein, partial [Mesorhizobium sp. M0520]|uniref:hypothetical protein n=1 Tax=Mesorhizobium sp. M0520 TaxID=2956957 RepID=UPI00333BF63B